MHGNQSVGGKLPVKKVQNNKHVLKFRRSRDGSFLTLKGWPKVVWHGSLDSMARVLGSLMHDGLGPAVHNQSKGIQVKVHHLVYPPRRHSWPQLTSVRRFETKLPLKQGHMKLEPTDKIGAERLIPLKDRTAST